MKFMLLLGLVLLALSITSADLSIQANIRNPLDRGSHHFIHGSGHRTGHTKTAQPTVNKEVDNTNEHTTEIKADNATSDDANSADGISEEASAEDAPSKFKNRMLKISSLKSLSR